MEASPPLPDSNDPYEILGLEYGCSERDLKRAYARLIRIYRPDRQPDQFRRVRAAFESVQEELGDLAPVWDESEYIDDALDPEPEEEPQMLRSRSILTLSVLMFVCLACCLAPTSSVLAQGAVTDSRAGVADHAGVFDAEHPGEGAVTGPALRVGALWVVAVGLGS